jgi:hypothetical protein
MYDDDIDGEYESGSGTRYNSRFVRFSVRANLAVTLFACIISFDDG